MFGRTKGIRRNAENSQIETLSSSVQSRTDKRRQKTTSIPPPSINAGLKEISRWTPLGAEDEGADMTDDISADISILAAFQPQPRQ